MPRKDLYEQCDLCDGKGAVPGDTRICADPPAALEKITKRRANGTYDCPSCRGRGFVATGLSAGQVERFIRERDELTIKVTELTRQITALEGAHKDAGSKA